jgi:hypothetical protein
MTRRFPALVALLVTLGACGGGSEPSDAGPNGDPGTIGRQGGEVSSSDGFLTVEIPAGALDEPTAIEISAADPAALGIDRSLIAGSVYDLSPSGLEFSSPVRVVRTLSATELGVAENAVPFFHVFQGSGEEWEPLSTETSRSGDILTVVSETTHFSGNVSVETTKLYGGEVTFELSPAVAPPTPVRQSFNTTWARGVSGFSAHTVDVNGFATGALARYDVSLTGTGVGTCGDAPGAGSYIASHTFEASASDPIDFLVFFLSGGARPAPTSHTISAAGTVECVEASTALGESVVGTASGTYTFEPTPGSVPGTGFTSDIVTRIEAAAMDLYRTYKTQQPFSQETDGPLNPVTGAYVATGGDGYSEFYLGFVCPLPDGSGYWDYGFNVGGAEGVADLIVATLQAQGLLPPIDNQFAVNLPAPPWLGECTIDEAEAMRRAAGLRTAIEEWLEEAELGWDFLYGARLLF